MATHELTQSVSNGPLTSSSYLFGAVDGSGDSAPDAFLITLVYDYIKSRTDFLYPTLAQYNSVLDTANTALNQGGGYWLGQSMPTTGFADAVDATGLVTKSQAEAIATTAGVNYVGLPVLTDIDQDNDLIQIYDVSAAGYYSVTPAELRSDVGLGTEDSPTFSGLGLASGSVITWDSGDLTLTQSSGLLTLAGGDFAVPDDAYAAGWNGLATVPTKNAIYDKIELILGTMLPATYQPLDSDLTSWAGVTRASGFDTFATTPSSANLKSLVTDETGSGGALVFATGPTISGLIATGSPTAAGATWTDLGTVTTADINGGTIDGAIIGGASAAAGTFTAIVGTSLSVGTGGVATVGTIEIGHASANTLAASGGHMTIEGAMVWDSGNDGSGSGLDADLLDGKHIGTSGNVVPLLDGTNTWSGVQTFGNTGIVVGASTPFSDSAGTLTLQNVDALDATTESTIEAAIDTLANLTSIQGRTVTLADAGVDAFLAWDDSASAYQNLSAADATAILNAFVGDSGSGGTKGLVPAPASGDASKFLKGDGSWAAIPGGGDALTSNPLSQFAATTSAQLAGVISDETGSGALVFATSPTLVTPALGTPASGTLTNCTGLPVAGGGTGAANAADARSNLGFGTAGAGNIFGAAINLGLSASVAGNALTIALKGADGNDPSATNPVLIPVRNTTDTTGTPSWLAVTAASSIVISSGSTLSTANSTAFRFYVVGFNDGGTFRLGVIHVGATGELGADMLASSTAEGGAGAADSIDTFYTGTAVASKYYCILGYVEYSSGLATAGTYASAPTKVQIYGAGSVPPLRAPTMQKFTASGTWTKPAGCRRIRVRVIGGGGGGAGGLGASSQIGMGSGGGSGGASVKDIDATNLSTETVTIGAAGAAGTSAPGNGGNGGTTSFGSHCSATGGSGGSTIAAGTSLTGAAGGSGGVGSGGDMNFSGGPGGSSLRISGTGGFPGIGGTGPMGGGGNMNASIVGAGVAGGDYGGGGSGALSNTTTGYAGGAGSAGLVIVEEFY